MAYRVSTEDKRTAYQNYLECWVARIKDPSIQELVRSALRSAPEYFWTKGYYHTSAPPDEQTRGGMLRRIYKDCYFVVPLIEAWGLETWNDQIIAATILHDCFKFGDDDTKFNKKRHGPETYKWLQGVWGFIPGDHTYANEEMIAAIIDGHDGTAWTENPVVRPIAGGNVDEFSVMSWLIHTVDVISSRPRNYFVWENCT